MWQMLNLRSMVCAIAILALCPVPAISNAGYEANPQGKKQDAANPGDSARYRPTAEYQERQLCGWRLIVSPDLLADEELASRTFAELERQLLAIVQVVPCPALEKLRQVTIWVEKDEPHHACMAYHPSRQWLAKHGINPDKARCVELANAKRFLSWIQDQPWMVLHELAHAYHDQFLTDGYGNQELREAWEKAKEKGLYESVGYIRGGKKRAYALTNPMEFFAETSEALFGKNDFFPYNKADLASYDPETYNLLCRLWGVPDQAQTTPIVEAQPVTPSEPFHQRQEHQGATDANAASSAHGGNR